MLTYFWKKRKTIFKIKNDMNLLRDFIFHKNFY